MFLTHQFHATGNALCVSTSIPVSGSGEDVAVLPVSSTFYFFDLKLDNFLAKFRINYSSSRPTF